MKVKIPLLNGPIRSSYKGYQAHVFLLVCSPKVYVTKMKFTSFFLCDHHQIVLCQVKERCVIEKASSYEFPSYVTGLYVWLLLQSVRCDPLFKQDNIYYVIFQQVKKVEEENIKSFLDYLNLMQVYSLICFILIRKHL